jgi:hypothetical protein
VTDGVTVDANIMKNFTSDYLAEQDSPSRLLVEKVLQNQGLVIDVHGKIQQEWFSTCGNMFFKAWFVEQVKLGLIRQVKPRIELHHKKHLTIKHGMPKGYDLVYVGVSNVTATRYIVTEDIDFFDPCLKKANQATKGTAKEKRDGAVCKYLRTEMKIRVGVAAHALNELFP